ncbi:MAG: alpha-glucosidase [Melioribacteraceae bacterium]|nr:MAG: alpha-glucosidase [Melioribacteraceae bacterium]
MKNLIFILILLVLWAGCSINENIVVKSPNGKNLISFAIDTTGTPAYSVKHNGKPVITPSLMGFDFKNFPSTGAEMKILNSQVSPFSEEWEMPWGEQRIVKNEYNELVVNLVEVNESGRKLNIYFRAYNDGVAFRYEFPETQKDLIITDENTQFNLTGDHKVWWIPGDWDIYEHLYNTTKFTEIDALSKRWHDALAQSYIPENAVNTPVTMKTEDGLYLSFHEANLTDYAGMTLKIDKENLSMTSELVGSDRFGWKVKRDAPFKTPWRTIQIAEKPGELIESKLIVNLNEPDKIGDVSWFKPMKYMGIWWEMHLGKSSWDMASGKHGATTKNAKAFIDFASQNNIKGLLVEGWNTGWERWIGFEDREGVFDFVTPYPDYDLEEVVSYGREKGVDIIMHHETSAAPRTYDQQLDTAYALMNRLGIHSVKTGYVGKIIPKGEYHHGQWMVNHYRRVLEKGAEYKVAINAHEPIKATGIRRTYPNAISREGLRGQEFNAWSSDGGNPPEHLSIVAFTRMLSGPIDFTPGVFNIKLEPYKKDNQVNTTIAHQLALYVVVYSPIQMACDLVENYEGNRAFQFIRDVGVDWEQTRVLEGEPGDFVIIAREERETGNWFVGGITDENEREATFYTDFLDPAAKYAVTLYKDSENAHWEYNPTEYDIEPLEIKPGEPLTIKMAPGGGFAISFMKR